MFRVFIAIGQTPFDPTSGAAQATLHMAEMLARHGCEVVCLSTTGTEGRYSGGLPHGSFVRNGVGFRLIEIAPERKHSWHHWVGREYDESFDRTLAEFRPDVLFTFGDEHPDRSRRGRAVSAGVRVVFCLHNQHYLQCLPQDVDVFLTPSRFLAETYRSRWPDSVRLVSLPTPIEPERVLASAHDPVFVTFINPQPSKGLWPMIRLAEQLGLHHPDIPLRIVEGRATAADFLAAAAGAGIDLGRFPNLFFSPGVADVREIWSTTRILLAPSVWEEPAGRVAVEAMLNGAVPIVSNRGGLAEQVGDAGIVLPLPDDISPGSRHLPAPDEIAPWIEALLPLCRDEARFADASATARSHAAITSPERIVGGYLDL
ncbi:MAG: glycosyltransferase, partial [Verrucomicrobiae bacterium]|nr:glycosyltransferase [Verrucomicrobiae bacterium]